MNKLVASLIALCLIAATASAQWQTNSAISSLDVNGQMGTASAGAAASGCMGSYQVMNSGSNAGTSTDVAITLEASGPSMAGSSPSNTVNINVGAPTFFNLNGGTPNFGGLLNLLPHPGAINIPLPTDAPLLGSAQQLAVDPSNGDGYTLSQASQLTITNTGVLTFSHVDDGFIVAFFGAPICNSGNNVTEFYGATYGDICSNSNGWCSFGAGSGDFTATLGEWQSSEPRIGLGADLEPNNYGTVSLFARGTAQSGNPNAIWLVMRYENMSEWGTTGSGITSYDIVLNGPQGHEIQNFTTDGTWGGTPTVVGMTRGGNGNAVHPPTVSFDALAGTGPQTHASTNASWLQDNTAGLIPTANWSTITWPTTYGDMCIVY